MILGEVFRTEICLPVLLLPGFMADEKSLIAPDHLVTAEKLVVDGIDG